jgi:hypothetical protein
MSSKDEDAAVLAAVQRSRAGWIVCWGGRSGGGEGTDNELTLDGDPELFSLYLCNDCLQH